MQRVFLQVGPEGRTSPGPASTTPSAAGRSPLTFGPPGAEARSCRPTSAPHGSGEVRVVPGWRRVGAARIGTGAPAAPVVSGTVRPEMVPLRAHRGARPTTTTSPMPPRRGKPDLQLPGGPSGTKKGGQEVDDPPRDEGGDLPRPPGGPRSSPFRRPRPRASFRTRGINSNSPPRGQGQPSAVPVPRPAFQRRSSRVGRGPSPSAVSTASKRGEGVPLQGERGASRGGQATRAPVHRPPPSPVLAQALQPTDIQRVGVEPSPPLPIPPGIPAPGPGVRKALAAGSVVDLTGKPAFGADGEKEHRHREPQPPGRPGPGAPCTEPRASPGDVASTSLKRAQPSSEMPAEMETGRFHLPNASMAGFPWPLPGSRDR